MVNLDILCKAYNVDGVFLSVVSQKLILSVGIMILSGNAFSASKETTSVLRQKRPPAVSLELINKATKDRLDTNASAEESSSATSEENSLDAGLKAMYAQDEYFRDSLTSWKSPTSPAGTYFHFLTPFYLFLSML